MSCIAHVHVCVRSVRERERERECVRVCVSVCVRVCLFEVYTDGALL